MSTVSIYEGFDLVGKTTLAKEISKSGIYRPDYSKIDKFYSRNLAFMFSYSQADIFCYMKDDLLCELPNLFYDRGLASSYVYSRLYKDEYPELPMEVVLDYFDKLSHIFERVIVIHVTHSSRVSAEAMYDHFVSHNDRIHERYDTFSDFNEYWERFNYAETLFGEVYDAIDRFQREKQRLNVEVKKCISFGYEDGLDFSYL